MFFLLTRHYYGRNVMDKNVPLAYAKPYIWKETTQSIIDKFKP